MKTHVAILSGALCAGILVPTLPSAASALPVSANPTAFVASGATATIPDPVKLRLSGLTADRAEITVDGIPGAWATVSQDGTPVAERQRINSRGQLVVDVPLAHGATSTFEATQAESDEAGAPISTPTSLTVSNDITELAAPAVESVLDVDYDTVPVRVSGQAGAEVEVKNSRGVVAGSGRLKADGAQTISVTLRNADGAIGPRFTVMQTYGGVTSPATAFHADDQTPLEQGDLVAPSITLHANGALTTIDAEALSTPSGAYLLISDLTGKAIARGDVVNGRSLVTITTPRAESRFTATVRQVVGGQLHGSAATDFTINEGIGSLVPDAPGVGDVSEAAGRLFVTVTGAPGALLTVTDDDGTTLAIKRLGSTATQAVIAFPAASVKNGSAHVTQSVDAIQSDPAPISSQKAQS